jgi:nicotinamidase-related amidase
MAGTPAQNEDLHGNVPDTADVALVLIDVINDLEFPGGDALLEQARPMAEQLAALKRRAKAADIPVIYVNDIRALVAHCLEGDVRGKPIVALLQPDPDDYVVLKPKHSGFFSTTLDTLLKYLQVSTLILTGVAGNVCVLFTANDAFMRDFRLIVPADCVASIDAEENRHALAQMRDVLGADLTPSTALDLDRLRRRVARPVHPPNAGGS